MSLGFTAPQYLVLHERERRRKDVRALIHSACSAPNPEKWTSTS